MVGKYKVITLCGSTRFKDAFMGEAFDPIKVSISQFHGIEINDFAETLAKTALWIAESQMMKATEEIVDMHLEFLPLKTNANIIKGNALRLNWAEVVSPDKLKYIMGNNWSPNYLSGEAA